jgi:hypothetical protein
MARLLEAKAALLHPFQRLTLCGNNQALHLVISWSECWKLGIFTSSVDVDLMGLE